MDANVDNNDLNTPEIQESKKEKDRTLDTVFKIVILVIAIGFAVYGLGYAVGQFVGYMELAQAAAVASR